MHERNFSDLRSATEELKYNVDRRDYKLACLMLAIVTLIVVCWSAFAVGSVIMVVLGSICVDRINTGDLPDDDWCPGRTGSVVMLVFGILLFVCCCVGSCCKRKKSNNQ
jgi:hypothetical protein